MDGAFSMLFIGVHAKPLGKSNGGKALKKQWASKSARKPPLSLIIGRDGDRFQPSKANSYAFWNFFLGFAIIVSKGR